MFLFLLGCCFFSRCMFFIQHALLFLVVEMVVAQRLLLLLLLIVSFFQPYQTPCTWPVAAWKASGCNKLRPHGCGKPVRAMACGCKHYNFTSCCCCCCCCWLCAVAVPVGAPIITIVGIFVSPHANSLIQKFCLPNYAPRSYYY